MDALRSAALLGDVSVGFHIWTGTWADVVLFMVYGFLLGLVMGWGWKVANKLP